jgi:hypothetical protein
LKENEPNNNLKRMTPIEMNLNKLLFYFCTVSVLASCSKNNDDNAVPSLGYSYFPLKQGQETFYQVDSIGWLGYTYDPITNTIDIDTVQYQVREVLESFFTDNAGRETARIVRYKRATPSDPWTLYKVYSANISATRAERFEDNVRYIKLVFPPEENEQWTGQDINVPVNDTVFEPWEYEYDEVNVSGTVGQIYYDSLSTVINKDEVNLIENRFYFEKYAAGFGLVYKEYNDLEYLNTTSSFIKNGFIYKETRFIP